MHKSNILETIATCIKEILPLVQDDQINPNISLRDLGANSMDRFDILMRVMESLDVEVSITEFATVKNIGGIIDLFERKIEALA